MGGFKIFVDADATVGWCKCNKYHNLINKLIFLKLFEASVEKLK